MEKRRYEIYKFRGMESIHIGTIYGHMHSMKGTDDDRCLFRISYLHNDNWFLVYNVECSGVYPKMLNRQNVIVEIY